MMMVMAMKMMMIAILMGVKSYLFCERNYDLLVFHLLLLLLLLLLPYVIL